ncbi:MAG: DUF2304 domain-containing protein [Culicoidibacterales bacterium]
MTHNLQLLLIIGSVGYFSFLMWKLTQSKDHVNDMIFPMIVSLFLIVVSIFPKILLQLSAFFGVQSEVNMIFIITIAILYFFVINLQAKIVKKQNQIKKLAQELALVKYEIMKNKNE